MSNQSLNKTNGKIGPLVENSDGELSETAQESAEILSDISHLCLQKKMFVVFLLQSQELRTSYMACSLLKM